MKRIFLELVSLSILFCSGLLWAADSQKEKTLVIVTNTAVQDYRRLKTWKALKQDLKNYFKKSDHESIDKVLLPGDSMSLPKVGFQNGKFSIKMNSEIVSFKVVDMEKGFMTIREREIHLDPKLSFQESFDRVTGVLSQKTTWHFFLPRAEATDSTLVSGKGLVILVLYSKFRDRFHENTLKIASRELEKASLYCNHLSLQPKYIKSEASKRQAETIRKKLSSIRSEYCGTWTQEVLSRTFGSRAKSPEYGGTYFRTCEWAKQIGSCIEARVQEDLAFDFAEIQRTLGYVPLSSESADADSSAAVLQTK